MEFPRTLLVAEIGINHNGDIALAEQMIYAAAEAGADAVKFQNYHTEDFLLDCSLTYTYNSQGREITESQLDMFKRCELARADLSFLKKISDAAGVDFFSTPTGADGIKDLIDVGVKWIKNGSDYLGHLPLIREMARSGIPTIISTGMAREEEITDAVNAFREAGGRNLVLLACTSAYPTLSENLHLRRITTLAQKYSCPAGFSDHSLGWEAAVAAVCVGACLVEKHFTINRNLPGPDHCFSATPNEFAELVRRVRDAEKMLGCAALRPTGVEAQARDNFRLSCTSACDLPAGAVMKMEDLIFRRPATGLPPKSSHLIVGKRIKRFIPKGTPLNLSDFEL